MPLVIPLVGRPHTADRSLWVVTLSLLLPSAHPQHPTVEAPPSIKLLM